ncbi:MAG TPA: hypothetical protein K8U77_02810 [Slackia equolifaciens]|uniref:Uncharacterized protein n=1 Tax=Slackia equolifaciens TaxID=498718 RepID=A0A9D2UVT5_9ACTN|nr:hypothetical protein [Slackia equolifaciens]
MSELVASAERHLYSQLGSIEAGESHCEAFDTQNKSVESQCEKTSEWHGVTEGHCGEAIARHGATEGQRKGPIARHSATESQCGGAAAWRDSAESQCEGAAARRGANGDQREDAATQHGNNETPHEEMDLREHPCDRPLLAISRIYAGSYCCERSFLGISDKDASELGRFCSANSIAITLVISSPLESMREAVYRKARHLIRSLGQSLDEICVNDIGTLARAIGAREKWAITRNVAEAESAPSRRGALAEAGALDGASASDLPPSRRNALTESGAPVKLATSADIPTRTHQTTPPTMPELGIVAGRLFFKQQRDPRTPEAIMPSHISAASLDLEHEVGTLSCIETDLAFTRLHVDASIPKSCTIALHYPFTLVSRMRVCQFAHDSNPASPFTATAPCHLECRHTMMEYRTHEGARFYKAGKAIMAPASASLHDAIRALPADRPIRIVWQPSFEEVAR